MPAAPDPPAEPATAASTSALEDQRRLRIEKAAALRALGVDPYPARSGRTHQIGEVLATFEALEGQTATIAGRLMSWRPQGGLTFGHVQDETGRIQLFIRRAALAGPDPQQGTLSYEQLKLLDLGDFLEASGTVARTQRGEISIMVESLRLLTKALRPLPEKWHGLRDREAIIRRRYLDTIMSPEHLVPFSLISDMTAAIRTFLNGRGFREFQTPVLQPQYGGGTARPFMTHVNALDCDMFLAISHELYLKRLIVAGFEKVYTIGRYFRNEGIDRSHNPEFSMVETMTAYENYEYNMQLVEDLFRHVATEVFHRTTFDVLGHQVDFAQPWRRVSMADAVRQVTGIDFAAGLSLDEANRTLAGLGVHEAQPSVGHALVRAFEAEVEPTLIQPTLVYGHPVEISPLAKPMAADPRFAERFEIFIAGVERGDNWTEQNDPLQLLATWQAARELIRGTAAEAEAHPLDYDFLEAMEHGMPPTTGIGPGVERMAMLFTEQNNIDEVLFFPMTRPALSPANAAIYAVEGAQTGASLPATATLTLEQWELLLTEGAVQPARGRVGIFPHLVVWPPSPDGRRATGYVELEGFAGTGRWRVPVLTLPPAARLDLDAARAALLAEVRTRVTAALDALPGGYSVDVAEVVVEGDTQE